MSELSLHLTCASWLCVSFQLLASLMVSKISDLWEYVPFDNWIPCVGSYT